jgi:hypothetical protein
VNHRPAIAGGGAGDVNFPAGVAQANQGSGTQKLGVIRMSEEREGTLMHGRIIADDLTGGNRLWHRL